jgi:D-glycero-D-manno-heptose 1,7-bisphosphate phosphatase
MGLDLARSAYVGDRLKDVQPAVRLGGKGYLVRTGYGREQERDAPAEVMVVDDLETAADAILTLQDPASQTET